MNSLDVASIAWRKSSHSGANESNCVELAAVWRKSTHSGGNDSSCVELAAAWRKSSYSGGQESECVEVAGAERVVVVRDSKNVNGPVLAFGRVKWRGLVDAIKAGSYDR